MKTCPLCNSPRKSDSTSLHGWSITFECNCQITGAIGSEKYNIDYICGEKHFELPEIKIKKSNNISDLITKYKERLKMSNKFFGGNKTLETVIKDLEEIENETLNYISRTK